MLCFAESVNSCDSRSSSISCLHVRGLTSFYNQNDHNTLTKTYLGHTGNLDYKDVILIDVPIFKPKERKY